MDARNRSARLNPPEPPDPSYAVVSTGESPASRASAKKIAARPLDSLDSFSDWLDSGSLEAIIAKTIGKTKKKLCTKYLTSFALTE